MEISGPVVEKVGFRYPFEFDLMFFSIFLSSMGVNHLRFVELWGSREDVLIDLLRVFSKSEGIDVEASETS